MLLITCCVAWDKIEIHTGIYYGNLKKMEQLEDLDIDGRIISKWILKKCEGMSWRGTHLIQYGAEW